MTPPPSASWARVPGAGALRDGADRACAGFAVADAAMQQDVAAVRALLQQGADVNGAQGDGMTALHWAAERGDQELAALLLSAGANPGAATRIGRHTPLHVAAKGGHHRVVRLLLDAKADVSALTTTGAAPLHFAAASGSAETIAILLDARRRRERPRAAVGTDAADVRGRRRAHRGRQDAAGARRRSARRRQRWSTSARAIARTAPRAARGTRAWPRSRRSVPPQARQAAGTAPSRSAPAARARARGGDDDSGNEPEPLGYADLVGAHGGLTALLLAARDGLDDTALALLDGGADINQVSAADRTSPLLMATINGHFDLAMRLLARGADVTHGERRRAQRRSTAC